MLKSMNTTQRELHSKLSDFERRFGNEADFSMSNIMINVQAVPTYHDFNYYITVELHGRDDWDKLWHERFCDEFKVILIDYRVKYDYAPHWSEDRNIFEYIYAPVMDHYCPIDFDNRRSRMYFKPEVYEFPWDCDEKARVLTHRLLNKLRELDNLNVDYERFIDKDYFRYLDGQLDYCLKHKDELRK